MTRTHRFALLSALYFSQGLPYGFFTLALPIVLRQRGTDLATIGASMSWLRRQPRSSTARRARSAMAGSTSASGRLNQSAGSSGMVRAMLAAGVQLADLVHAAGVASAVEAGRQEALDDRVGLLGRQARAGQRHDVRVVVAT